jgi:hypothetical protein
MIFTTTIHGKKEELQLYSSEKWFTDEGIPVMTNVYVHPVVPDYGSFEVNYSYFSSGWDDITELEYQSNSFGGDTLEEDIDAALELHYQDTGISVCDWKEVV